MLRKRLVSIVLLVAIALLTLGCANPEAEYKTQLQDALLKYDQWKQASVVAFNKLQDEKTSGNPEVTYGQLITNTIQSHNSGDTRRADLTWNSADLEAVKGQAQMVYDGARPLLTALEKMTPSDKMKDPHLILQECVKYQMNIAATLLIFLNDNKFEPVNYSTKPCQDVDLAIVALKQYSGKK